MAQQETGRSLKWLWWRLAVLLVALIAFAVYRMNNSVVVVRSATVERQDIVSTVSTNGRVEPSNEFQAHAPMAGVVGKVFVGLNQQVKTGQELVKMDDSGARKAVAEAAAALASAKSNLDSLQHGGTQDERLSASGDLQSAQLQQKQAQATLNSLKQLQAQGAASASEVSAAEQRLNQANAKVSLLQQRRTGRYSTDDIDVQRSQVAQAQASLDAARTELADVDIYAPFGGTVFAIPVHQYDFVNAGDMLLKMADLSKMQVRAYFDEPEIGKLAIGQPVTIVWDAKPNRIWHGHVLEAPTTVITYNGTRNVGECLISVDDANGDLLPNINVTVKVTTLNRSNVLSLPREALHTEGTSNFVFKIVDGHLQKTPVSVGVVNLTRVEITGGLQSSDLVALGATTEDDLSNGLKVKVKQ
jgi:HlyD family secretion protein